MTYWSFFNGLLAVPFGAYESWTWVRNERNGLVNDSRYVTEIWLERTLLQVIAYILGQFAYVSLPIVLLLLAHALCLDLDALVVVTLFLCPGLFTVFTVFTLFVPVGAAKRYRRLGRHSQTGYERLFLGQMPPHLLFAAKGDGLRACLWEAALYLLLIMFGAGVTQLCVFGLDGGAFHFDESYNNPTFGVWEVPTFLYFSIMTIFTVGYGDISPVHTASQAVAICEVILGWMYLGAFFPALVGLTVEHRDEDMTATDERFQNNAISTSIHQGVRWLVDQQKTSGEWRYPLTPDLLATSAAFIALNAISQGDISDAYRNRFEAYFRHFDGRSDAVGRIAQRIALGEKLGSALPNILNDVASRTNPEDHCAMIVGVLAVVGGSAPLSDVRRYFPDDLESWDDTYGSHWDCYALVARLLISQIEDGGTLKPAALTPAAADILKMIDQRRTDRGSWYHDILLTSIIMTVVSNCGLPGRPNADTKEWLKKCIEQSQDGIPLVDGLAVWDTAWGVAALLNLTGESMATRNGIAWIIHQQDKRVKGLWSWSDGSILPCNDTTSLVCDVLRQTVIREVTVDAVVKATEAELQKAASGHQYSTFGRDAKQIHSCPIISSRCVRIMHARSGKMRDDADKILSDILEKNWTSYWFTDPSISDGLALYYLAQIVSPRSTNLIGMIERLCAHPISTTEGAATSILGLQEVVRSVSSLEALKAKMSERINHLTDYVLSQQDARSWRGAMIGVFGFGRRYADSIFATSLALLALSRVKIDRP